MPKVVSSQQSYSCTAPLTWSTCRHRNHPFILGHHAQTPWMNPQRDGPVHKHGLYCCKAEEFAAEQVLQFPDLPRFVVAKHIDNRLGHFHVSTNGIPVSSNAPWSSNCITVPHVNLSNKVSLSISNNDSILDFKAWC